jgi:hypothetical protein
VDANSLSVATAAAQLINMNATHKTESTSPTEHRNTLSRSLIKKVPDASRARLELFERLELLELLVVISLSSFGLP